MIKLYRYVDIYYLKLLQHLVGAIVGSLKISSLGPELLLGGKLRVELREKLRAELCTELRAELRAELCAEPRAGVQTCRYADVQTFVRAINCRRL